MKPNYFSIVILLVSLFLVFIPMVSAQRPAAAGQGAASSATSAVTAEVPRLIKFSGTLLDVQERPLAGPVGVAFALYAQQTGGAALWLETQNVKPDGNGNYTVLLGANSANGVPADLFASGEARWLGVQVEHDVEQPRVLLVSVPYALKAVDAETLGGLPPSAFARAGSPAESSNAASSGSLLLPVPSPAASSFNASTDPNVTTLGGTVNFVPKFDTASEVKTSQIFDNGTDVGIGFPVTPTPVPVAKLDLNGSANIRGSLTLPATGTATATAGFNSQPMDLVASSFNKTISTAVNQHFRLQAEAVSNDSSNPSGKLSLLFGAGASTPAETGLSISNTGLLTFASGQTFPTVTGNETVTGNLSASLLISTAAVGTAPLKVTSTTLVPNLNASFLGGLGRSAFALLGSPNVFTQGQTIFGKLGIGTTTPAYAVHAYGSDSGLGIRIKAENTSTGPGNSLAGFFANANAGNVAAVFYADGLGTGPLGEPGGYYGTFTNQPLGLFTDNTERIRIAATGEVSIGTKVQGAQLRVAAQTASQTSIAGIGGSSTTVGVAAGTGVQGFGGVATAPSPFIIYGGDGVVGTGGNSSAFGGNGIVGTGGNAGSGGVGVVATGGNATSGDGGFGVQATGGNATMPGGFGGIGIQATGGTSNGIRSQAAFFSGDIGVQGCVEAIGATIQDFGTCSSDVRLKRNIEAFPAVLDKIVQLRPVWYNWRTEEYPQFRFPSGRASGLVAQDVEQVFPEMVTIDEAGFRRVNYGELPYLMLQAIRELKAENDNLRERIQRLEAAATRTP